MKSARIITGSILLVALSIMGCESKSVLQTKVTGKVTYKGTAVGGGTIAFYTADGQVVSADINRDGTYSIGTLSEGTFTVTIESESVNPDKKVDAYRSGGGGPKGIKGAYGKGSGGPGGVAKESPKEGAPKSPMPEGRPAAGEPNYVKIPAKYADKGTSGLSVTLKKGDQTHNFDLTD